MADLSGAIWRKSTRSDTGGGSCVEVAKNLPGIVGIRDSKNRSGPTLSFDPQTWAEFIAAIKIGEFGLSGD